MVDPVHTKVAVAVVVAVVVVVVAAHSRSSTKRSSTRMMHEKNYDSINDRHKLLQVQLLEVAC